MYIHIILCNRMSTSSITFPRIMTTVTEFALRLIFFFLSRIGQNLSFGAIFMPNID